MTFVVSYEASVPTSVQMSNCDLNDHISRYPVVDVLFFSASLVKPKQARLQQFIVFSACILFQKKKFLWVPHTQHDVEMKSVPKQKAQCIQSGRTGWSMSKGFCWDLKLGQIALSLTSLLKILPSQHPWYPSAKTLLSGWHHHQQFLSPPTWRPSAWPETESSCGTLSDYPSAPPKRLFNSTRHAWTKSTAKGLCGYFPRTPNGHTRMRVASIKTPPVS